MLCVCVNNMCKKKYNVTALSRGGGKGVGLGGGGGGGSRHVSSLTAMAAPFTRLPGRTPPNRFLANQPGLVWCFLAVLFFCFFFSRCFALPPHPTHLYTETKPIKTKLKTERKKAIESAHLLELLLSDGREGNDVVGMIGGGIVGVLKAMPVCLQLVFICCQANDIVIPKPPVAQIYQQHPSVWGEHSEDIIPPLLGVTRKERHVTPHGLLRRTFHDTQ